MEIPTRFQLLGRTIAVEYNDGMRHKDNALGLACYREDKIKIQPSIEGHPRTREDIEQTFCHELMHYIFHNAGYLYSSDKELNDQEGLVEMCGGLLHQALATMEYAEPDD